MQEGRNMTMMMAPSKAVLAGRLDADRGADAAGVDGGPAGQAPAISPAAPNGGASSEQPPASNERPSASGEQPPASGEAVSVDGSGPSASTAVP
jgi:hypothetical protein